MDIAPYDMDISPYELEWDIRREGHAWGERNGTRDRATVRERWQRSPEKVEMIDARIFGTDEQRLRTLGLLLENLGIDAVVRFGDPKLWRAALDNLENSTPS